MKLKWVVFFENPAFARAGLANEAVKFLEDLASCAVAESRFGDASWYYWKLSSQCAEVAKVAEGELLCNLNNNILKRQSSLSTRILNVYR